MTRGYKIESNVSHLGYDEIIVSNFHFSNKVANWVWFGKSNKQTLGDNSIGKWKIKKLKQ